MATPNSTNAIVRTWADPKFLELDKNGIYPLQGQLPLTITSVSASATLNPLFQVQAVSTSSGNVTLTLPASAALGPYIGRRFLIFTNTFGNNLVVTSTGGLFVIPGSAAVTSLTTTTNTQSTLVELYVLSSTQIIVTNRVNVTAA